MDSTEMRIIRHYADRYLTYKEISLILVKQYDIILSPNAIRKRIRRMGMPSRRGPTENSLNEVKTAIQLTLPTLPHTVGYRQMTCILRQKQIHVRRDQVMELMRELDPEAVHFRRRRRIKRKVYRTYEPNHLWHVDGYSRKILWLEVGPSNNNPAVVAHNYVSCVDKLKGCPMVLQSDPGTENCIMGALQCMFKHNASDCFAGIHSYRVVRSVFNQRIEAWWSMLRRQQSEWWISFLKDLETFGGFQRENEKHLYSIRYCFMPVLQNDLDLMKDKWNNHFITHSRQGICPNGRPIVLYAAPDETCGFKDCLYPLQDEDRFAYSQTLPIGRSGCSQFDTRAHDIFQLNGWHDASNWQEALQQYFRLIEMDIQHLNAR